MNEFNELVNYQDIHRKYSQMAAKKLFFYRCAKAKILLNFVGVDEAIKDDSYKKKYYY